MKNEKKHMFSSQSKQTAAIDAPSFSLIAEEVSSVPPRNPLFSCMIAVRSIKSHVSHLSLE